MIMAAIANELADDAMQHAFSDGPVEESIRPLIAMEEFSSRPPQEAASSVPPATVNDLDAWTSSVRGFRPHESGNATVVAHRMLCFQSAIAVPYSAAVRRPGRRNGRPLQCCVVRQIAQLHLLRRRTMIYKDGIV